jgi:hypothetical protein
LRNADPIRRENQVTMESKSDREAGLRLRGVLKTSLSGMLILLIMMFLSDYVRLGIGGDFSSLKEDPGIGGLWLLTVLVCLNLLAQLAVQLTESKAVKIAVTVFVGCYGLFFLSHQLIHYRSGGFAADVHLLLDCTHHVLAGFGLWAGIRWVKLG